MSGMKISLESTETLVHVNGTLCRLWTGKDGNGLPVRAYIATIEAIAVPDGTLHETDKPIMTPDDGSTPEDQRP